MEGSDGARGKANPSPKGKPKGPTPKGKAKAKAKGKGKGKGWNAKAKDDKDVAKEAQKVRAECFELVCSVAHLVQQIKDDPMWEWARNDQTCGYLEKSLYKLQKQCDSEECHAVVVAQSINALKEEFGDEFEERMSLFVDVMGPRIAAVKSDRQFLFDSKKLRVQREQNDSQAC